MLLDIVKHPLFQRLTRIKQLGLTNVVYPGAQHTRFQHSLGAFHLTSEAILSLTQKGVFIFESEAEAVQAAILMHDIGHGPFSHVLENTLIHGISHEEISLMMMNEINHDLGDNLTLAIKIFKDEYPKRFLHQLISSQLDMDRLDYLRRDSFFTGVTEGNIGSARIIKMLNVVDDNLVVDSKGIYSIENYLTSRRLMYWQVYMHKTVVAADNLMVKVLTRARDLQAEGGLSLRDYPVSSHLSYFLEKGVRSIGDEEAIRHYLLLDDSDVWSSVKTWSLHKDRILSFLATSLMNRSLGKIIISDKAFDEEQKSRLCRYESEEEKRYFTASDKLHNKAYNFSDTGINILFKDGSVKEICEASDQLDRNFLSKEICKYFYYQI